MSYLLVFLGGGLGAVARHGVNRASLVLLGSSFPFSTILVNVSGGLMMGIVVQWFLTKGGGSQEVRLFLTTGILGGFTTFSAFSLDAALMWQRGDWAILALYVLGSVVLSIGALFLGMSAAQGMT